MAKKENNVKKRGFASMSPEKRKEIASKGGKASSTNFKHDKKRAREIGRRGGLAVNSRNDRD